MSESPNPDLLATLARDLATDATVEALLQRAVDASITQIDGAEHAGITTISRGAVATPVASGDLVRRIDHIQYTVGEGPCLTAATEREPVVVVPDLTTDPRWPNFSMKAAEQGIRSMLSFQLYTGVGAEADTIGALNIYASAPGVFTEDSVHTGTLLATHAALAAVAMAKTDHLHIALQSRDVIGQAKGILMERFRLTPDQAFDLLIAASQRANLKLRDIAERLATTGELVTD